ncbi:MFS transporter [Nonomuraea phyllanthi]|uniref:MFS transporter n=1 Tax=Nonomuraea phyllanthi TaxID=2219224 RepID=A0A5C4WK91_9ACTN|nr:MFS transporter [Nonomuraea phyllanthi]KAB8194273.1 MFS transporter [Nonomuraea phyllanthi]
MNVRITAVVLAAGVAASTALGEFIPFLTVVGEEFTLPPATVGWLSSAITVVAAAACLPLGLWLDPRPLRGIFMAALAVLGAAGSMAAVTGDAVMLAALRLAQAAGYAVVMIAGPGLLARLLTGRARRGALALWGLCIPAGLALANTAGALAAAAGWRATIAGVGALTMGVAALAGTLPRDAAPTVSPGLAPADVQRFRPAPAGTPKAAVAALAAGFAMIATVGVCVVTVLPAFLTTELRLPGSTAGLLAAVVAAASVPGSLAAGAALRAGTAPGRLIGAALLMVPAGAGTFLPVPAPAPVAAALVALCAAAVLGLNGLAVSAVFAALPAVAGARTAWAIGAVTQAGSLGTFLGPPLYVRLADTGSWSTAFAVTAALVAAGVACAKTAQARGIDSGDRSALRRDAGERD